MRFSSLRIFQWSVIALVLAALVGLNYDFDSEAGMRMNASVEDPLSQGLLGYWKMDEGTGTSTTADASGNANTLTMTNADAEDWQTGQVGPYSLDFNGTDEYLTIASPSSVLDFPAGASFSLTGWFNRDLFVNDHTILSNVAAQGNDGYIIWIDGDDSLYFRADDNADANYRQLVSAATFAATGWHHFAVSWEDDRDADLYIDGALDASTKTGTFASVDDLTNALAFRIGAETDAGNPFDGKLDDIRVYGYPLSASEVLKLYQTTAPAQPVDTGLVGHWTFDGPDIQGATAIDRSSFGNNGTITGAVPTIGKLGQGLQFNGTGDYVSIGDDILQSQTFSVSVWAKVNTNHTGTIIVGSKNTCNNDWGGFCLYVFSGTFQFDALTNGATGLGSIAHGIGEWHHLVAIINHESGTVSWYGDASLIGNINFSDTFVPGILRIGIDPYVNGPFNGSIDDVRIYNRALSATEVSSLYKFGK